MTQTDLNVVGIFVYGWIDQTNATSIGASTLHFKNFVGLKVEPTLCSQGFFLLEGLLLFNNRIPISDAIFLVCFYG